MSRIAVVLCNLGGPDAPETVKPFLDNLFADPAILPLPQPFRWLLGTWIVRRRLPVALSNYRRIGGGSPLLAQTRAQAAALQERLSRRRADVRFRCYVSMRYWHPMAAEVAAEVAAENPDRVILLPLYPQYSTTTTASTLADWRQEAAKRRISCPQVALCCWPTQPGWIHAVAQSVEKALAEAGDAAAVRVVFSAHGLPKSIVDAGDPYPAHVEAGVHAVVAELCRPGLDWVLSYQSRVGPQTWIGPETDEVIKAAGAEGKIPVVVPISFVSEHTETLVELDMDARELAEKSGATGYFRVPTVQCDPFFIGGLADLVDFATDCPVPEDGWLAIGDACRRACLAGAAKCPLEER